MWDAVEALPPFPAIKMSPPEAATSRRRSATAATSEEGTASRQARSRAR